MDLLTALHISATGLRAQRTRMNVIATNLANANTSKTQKGTPYRRKVVLLETQPVEDFDSVLGSQFEAVHGVKVSKIVEDTSPFRRMYSPGHPDADEMGYVSLPNVNVVTEMTNLMLVRRAYEANVSVISATKGLALKALEIGK